MSSTDWGYSCLVVVLGMLEGWLQLYSICVEQLAFGKEILVHMMGGTQGIHHKNTNKQEGQNGAIFQQACVR